jgi:hypothetical protein
MLVFLFQLFLGLFKFLFHFHVPSTSHLDALRLDILNGDFFAGFISSYREMLNSSLRQILIILFLTILYPYIAIGFDKYFLERHFIFP